MDATRTSMIGDVKLMNEESTNEKRQSSRPETAHRTPLVDFQLSILRSSISNHPIIDVRLC